MTSPKPIGYALLVRPGVVRVLARVESDEIPGLVGDYDEELPIEALAEHGFRLAQPPAQVGDEAKVYALERAG